MIQTDGELVVVPEVVGKPFHVGVEIAAEAGLTLANPDPDGPPMGALAWPGLFYITAQEPPPGTEVSRWTDVVVEITPYGVSGSDVPRVPSTAPPIDVAHAKAQRDIHIDVVGDGEERPEG